MLKQRFSSVCRLIVLRNIRAGCTYKGFKSKNSVLMLLEVSNFNL